MYICIDNDCQRVFMACQYWIPCNFIIPLSLGKCHLSWWLQSYCCLSSGRPKGGRKSETHCRSYSAKVGIWVLEGVLAFFFLSRGDENRTVTHDGNITNLVRILDDYSFPIGMTFQDLSSIFKKPALQLHLTEWEKCQIHLKIDDWRESQVSEE